MILAPGRLRVGEADADLGWRPTPHTLKHTAIAWAIEGGASMADAAGFFATITTTIERVYGHRSPHFQAGVVRESESRRQNAAKPGTIRSSGGETGARKNPLSVKALK